MQKRRIEDSVGAVLCHDMTAILPDGSKGVRFPRNHIIREEDLPILKDMGKRQIYVWEPGKGEVHEEDCARAMGAALLEQTADFSLSGPSEGKCVLIAKRSGLLQVARRAIERINSIPDWSFLTLQNLRPVAQGEMVAAWRILPLVTQQQNLTCALQCVRDWKAEEGNSLLHILPYRSLRTGVIVTGSEIYERRIPDAFGPLLQLKLKAFPGSFGGVRICSDSVEQIVEALEAFRVEGCQLILLTGGMSVDPDDVTPVAIQKSGAQIQFRGVPMQPGNLLLCAKWGDQTLVGVPGASLHAARTSLDWLLPRIFADCIPNQDEVHKLGVGGLQPSSGEAPWLTRPVRELEEEFRQAREQKFCSGGER